MPIEYKQYVLNTNCLYSIHTNPFTMYWTVLVQIGLDRIMFGLYCTAHFSIG